MINDNGSSGVPSQECCLQLDRGRRLFSRLRLLLLDPESTARCQREALFPAILWRCPRCHAYQTPQVTAAPAMPFTQTHISQSRIQSICTLPIWKSP